ncbi:hypothetical protein [Streptomyces sp. VRA16 Mangrove soil]|uniref:hypothetical protein n=1 Tax=Streptomyces sp. VRA16 Mangrove soil TaxID=2817434 RepID=UPI001A9EA52B|nr:hypothetical protein [Streptomyces sp. VRA16 Mangrove soil]MBO1329874.1 hypothetical protein [Streptomyces sp. VRA16 Mangrove soil]
MQLHLKYLLEPDSASRLAADVVATASDISGADLDYSPGSIGLLEEIVDDFRSDGATGGEMAESLVAFGCYVGEILIRHVGGAWRHCPAETQTVPLAVELLDGRRCRPVDWVFDRLEHGSAVSIRSLYDAADRGTPGAARTTAVPEC